MIQLSEIESSRKELDNKINDFRKQLNEFNSIHFPNGTIDSYANMVMVYSKNTVDWNKSLHCRLCDEFGLKLIEVEKREYYDYPIRYQVFWKYTDKNDTNFKEFDFDKVRL